jgi:hypothetical protein
MQLVLVALPDNELLLVDQKNSRMGKVEIERQWGK